ncbi:hypothetical protein AB6A40_008578 [Gnathostoma spinigerum]|uniref:Uncharacterized protein n=1 Tax=Gnathostoma spinigerum TaxID=75299 RepID=A0ABD6EPH0_9BILA
MAWPFIGAATKDWCISFLGCKTTSEQEDYDGGKLTVIGLRLATTGRLPRISLTDRRAREAASITTRNRFEEDMPYLLPTISEERSTETSSNASRNSLRLRSIVSHHETVAGGDRIEDLPCNSSTESSSIQFRQQRATGRN